MTKLLGLMNISPSYWALQAFGYNVVRLYPDVSGTDSKVTLKFRGVVQESNAAGAYSCYGNLSDWLVDGTYKEWCNLIPDSIGNPASSWHWALVAVSAEGKPRYSDVMKGTSGDLIFDVKSTDKALYLTVSATPSEYQMILWDQFYYTIYRYPYMIELVNARPEGYESGAWVPSNTDFYKQHINGGGWVLNAASVASTVYVGPKAVVNGGSVSGNARIEDFAVINGGTISGSAVVRGRALVTAGTISDNAILEEDAWLVSGSISENAKVGALTVLINTNVSGSAQVYGVMWALDGKTVTGTAQLRGDLENNFSSAVSSGIFYGIIGDADLTSAKYGASLTSAAVEVTASMDDVTWWESSRVGSVLHRNPGTLKIQQRSAFEWDVTLPEGTKSLRVINLQGKEVLQKEVSLVNSQRISLEAEPRGVYGVVIKGSSGVQYSRILR
jgi:hypothetical protein